MICLIFGLFLWLYSVYSRFQIRRESLAKWNKVAQVVNTRHRYDAVNELVLEHNQRIMVKATEDLYQSMVAREKAMDSAKHHHRLDDDEVVPINRFSMNLKSHHHTGEGSQEEGGADGEGDNDSDDSSDRFPGALGSGFGVLCSPSMVEPGSIKSPNGHSPSAAAHAAAAAGGANTSFHTTTGQLTTTAAAGPMSIGGPMSVGGPMSATGPMSNMRQGGPMSATGSMYNLHGGGPLSVDAPGGMMRSPPAPLMKRLSMRTRTGKVQREGTRLAKQLQATMEHYQYDDVEVPLTISFRNMSLTLKASGTVVLRNICVSIKPFNVTAIMGPSGAGKTTFLSLLRGQAHYARVTGAMTVNDHPVESLERLKTRTAYVPQDDIVNDELSVEENIMYSALLFNKRGHLRVAEVMPMVIQAERLLDIIHIRTSVVGSAAKRGISGGQKKRVSIGMELMKEADMFFLDEPTSGLDSASSMLVVNALHFLASKGVNVSTTIHQPRQEILNLMDNLLLLAPGGRVTYYGPIIDLHYHFSQLNYTCPMGINIADYVMDTLCGFVPEDNNKEVRDVQETIDVLCDWWEENRYPLLATSSTPKRGIQRQLSTLAALESPVQSPTKEREWRYYGSTQNFKVFLTCFRRQVKVNQRTLDVVATTCGLLLLFGIIVAFLSGPVALDGTSGSISSFSAQVTSGALVFSLLLQAACLRLFSADQLLRDREFTAGLQIAPYFVGKILGNFIEPCFYAFAFLVGNYPFIKARAPFADYWYCFFLLHLAISGMVNFIVIAYPGANKATFSVGCVVLLWSFGGVSPPIKTMEDSMGAFASILNAISPFTYGFEVEVINELTMYPQVWNVEALLARWSYRSVHRDKCIGGLIVYFFVANLFAYFVAEVQPHWPKIKKDTQEFLYRISDGAICASPSRVFIPSDSNSNSEHNSATNSNNNSPTVPVGSKKLEKISESESEPAVALSGVPSGRSGYFSNVKQHTGDRDSFGRTVSPHSAESESLKTATTGSNVEHRFVDLESPPPSADSAPGQATGTGTAAIPPVAVPPPRPPKPAALASIHEHHETDDVEMSAAGPNKGKGGYEQVPKSD